MDKDDEEKIASSIRGIHKIFQDGMNELGEKYFGSRKELNREKRELLKVDKDFARDINKIRKDFGVPKLKLEQDLCEIPHPKYIDAKSTWLGGQSEYTKKKFSRVISEMLKEYELPFYFDEWLEMHILYKHPISEAPLHRWDYCTAIYFGHTEELERIPPTSQEKKLLKEEFRRVFKIKGKPTKDRAELYQYFLKALARLKNKRRRSRALDTNIKTLNHQKPTNEYDEALAKKIKHRKTFSDIVGEIYSEKYETETGAKKLAARLRKQKQRLLKRHPSFKKAKK